VQALVQQKKYLEVQLKEAKIQKERLTLKAPEDAKVLKILAKEGEMVSANTPVILLESKRDYYDIYVSEKQAAAHHAKAVPSPVPPWPQTKKSPAPFASLPRPRLCRFKKFS
jgi:pyruvate/2-oxoglutarate dehydrogenase complex dihydrolipoamide acyltransferase (E2) component